jgi:hypothetical protein
VNLSPDTYTVTVTLTGFTSLKRTGITIRAGEGISLGALALAVGSLSETVLVAGEAPMPARAVPKGAGFGVANVYQSPRTIQVHVRVTF